MTVVLAGGVFDVLHIGHVQFLQAAKKMGDTLVVVVSRYNHKREPVHTAQQRQKLVASLKIVDQCVIGDKSDMFRTVKKIKPDIIALGYNQRHDINEIKDGCKKIGLDNIKIKRIKIKADGISTSKLLELYNHDRNEFEYRK